MGLITVPDKPTRLSWKAKHAELLDRFLALHHEHIRLKAKLSQAHPQPLTPIWRRLMGRYLD